MKLENSYDVVIAGAGPAGSITARDCAKAGLKVLLLEKRPEIGAPKRCGEGIGLEALKKLGYTGDEAFVTERITGNSFIMPNGKVIEIHPDGEGRILERKVFDKFLAYDAAKAGAKVIANAEAVELLKRNGKAAGVVVDYNSEKLNVSARVVVAADGVESKIARMAGLNTHTPVWNVISCYQYEMAGIDIGSPNTMYLYFGHNVAPGGYLWIFPKGDHVANIGVGLVLAKKNGGTAKYYLNKWIDSAPSIKKGSIIEENAGGIPFGGFLKKMTADSFLAVGDAAHQVNPVHGGGIAEAAFAGRLAAKVIARAIKEGDTSDKNLDEYNRVWWKERGNTFARLEKLVNECLMLSDEEIIKITDSLGNDGVAKILKGDITFIAKIVAKNPKIAAIAAKVMI